MALHSLSLPAHEQYAEHHASSMRHFLISKQSRRDNFHEAANAHHAKAREHQKVARGIVKSSPVTSPNGVQAKDPNQQFAHDQARNRKRYN